MSLVTFIILSVTIILATILKSITGFGTSLILMPILSYFFDIKLAALILALIDLTSNAILFYRDSRHATLKSIKEVATGLLFGTVLGVLLFHLLNVSALRVTLGVLILAYVIYNHYSPTITIRSDKMRRVLGYVFGIIGGVFGGLFNANGPAVFMYIKSVFPDKEVVRANLILLFLIDSAWRVGLHTVTGQYTTSILLTFAMIALPSLLFGLYAGSIIDKNVKSNHYTNLSKIILAISGIKLLLH